MKALGALILLVLVGYVGYQYAYPPLADFLALEKPKPPVIEIEQPKLVVLDKPKPEPVMEPKPEPPKPAMTEPTPVPPPMPQVADMGASVAKLDADGFTPPTFQPIEDLVKNWTEIPKGAFLYHPQVKLLKAVEFVASINGNKFSSKIPAGGTAVALAQEPGGIVLAPSPSAPARATVPLEFTDLQRLLTANYEAWKVRMTERKRREFLFAKNSSTRVADPKASGGAAPAPVGAPKKNPEGSYDILLASMKAGQVTEITPQNVKKWGDVAQEKIDGKDYFTIIVDYTTKTMFGDFDTQAQARIAADGKVEKWIYTGSGEVVP
ncbi:MAG: hypothetical protein ACOYMN_08505 [Roseimicrobium sp.]